MIHTINLIGTLIVAFYLLNYLFFILPGTTEDIVSYNQINQSLIELKVSVKTIISSFFNNPGNPGNTGGGNTISPISSQISDHLPTVTPNTPIVSNITINDTGVQTNIDGITVSKMVETMDILSDIIGQEESTIIKDNINIIIKNITD